MTPLSYWIYFHVALVVLLGVEYLLHLAVPNIHRKAIYATVLWVSAALGLAAIMSRHFHAVGATQYLAGYALEQALSLDKGSAEPHRDKVAKITAAQLREIAEKKMKDLNANDIDAAAKIIAGTARSMGVDVV